MIERTVTKEDYYLAQIAAEIRQFREIFAKTPKSIGIEDCLIKYKDESENKDSIVVKEPKIVVDCPDQIESLPEEKTEQPKGIEIGPDALKDPKWAKVTAAAKAGWFGYFGAASEDDFSKPTQEQIDEFLRIQGEKK